MTNAAILKSEDTSRKHFRVQADPIHRILMVEDDGDIRRINTEALVHYGYDVDVAEDGEIAWAALTTMDYDLMITDNNMPKLTGVQLLKKLHGARMALPVIMATATEPKWEFTHNPLIVPAAMLLKPYTIAELLSTVRSVLRATVNPDEAIVPPLTQDSPPFPNRLEL